METNGNRGDAKWDAFEEMMENKVVFTVPIDESVKAGVVTSVPTSGSARRSML